MAGLRSTIDTTSTCAWAGPPIHIAEEVLAHRLRSAGACCRRAGRVRAGESTVREFDFAGQTVFALSCKVTSRGAPMNGEHDTYEAGRERMTSLLKAARPLELAR